LQKLVGEDSVKDQIDQAITAALSGEESGTQKYALSGDLDNAENRIKDLEDIVTTEAVQNWNTQADWTETNESSIAFIKNKPTNLITAETLFTYGEGETATQKTIAELFAYIATLEARIATLEGHHPTEDDEGTAT
jgi:hypothetical protein